MSIIKTPDYSNVDFAEIEKRKKALQETNSDFSKRSEQSKGIGVDPNNGIPIPDFDPSNDNLSFYSEQNLSFGYPEVNDNITENNYPPVEDVPTSPDDQLESERKKYVENVLSIKDIDKLYDIKSKSEGKAVEKRYVGLDFSNEQMDIDVLSWSKVIQNSKQQNLLLKDLIAPWDRRFKDIYTSSQSIGNSMPYGPEWLGSPSIMNPHALIRFEHIASTKHHKLLMDQMGSNEFRSPGLYYPPLKASDLKLDTLKSTDGSDVKIAIDGDEYSAVSASDELKKDYNVQGSVYQDEEGGMFSYDIDKNLEIWECKNPSALPNESDGKKLQTLAPLLVDSSKPENDPRPGSSGPGITISDDKVTEYWAIRKGLVRCEAGASLNLKGFTSSTICEAIKEGKQIPAEEQQKVQKQFAEIEKYVNSHKTAQWTFKEYQRNKKYLRSRDFIPMVKTDLEPTYGNLVNPDNWKGNEQFLYDWSDFLYLKHYDGLPNNRLITLRRFPVPVMDHAKVPSQDDEGTFILPVAKACTHFDASTGNTLESILGFAWKMNWGELTANVQELTGNETGVDSAFGSDGIGGKIAKALMGGGLLNGTADFGSISGYDEQRAKFNPYADGPYANEPQGPVNVIMKSKKREQGLEFEHSMTLKFYYTLRSIGGVNPKAAMLDILANFLALTYNNAPFWGGAIRYFPNKPAYPFPGGKKGMDQWYNGDISGFMDSVGDMMTSALGNLGDMLMGLFSDPVGQAKKLLTGGAKLWMAKKQNGNRPNILGFKALLTGEPVGEWHLSIGNPFNPIALIGNLVVSNATINFNEELGVDDFPTEMILSVTLDHGKPRDRGDIESMFNRGNGRLYYSYFGKKDILNQTSATEITKNASKASGMNDAVINDGSNRSGDKGIIEGTGQQSSRLPQTKKSKSTKRGLSSSDGFKRDLLVSSKEADGVFNSSFRNISKVYSAGSRKAIELSEKVGFKQSSE